MTKLEKIEYWLTQDIDAELSEILKDYQSVLDYQKTYRKTHKEQLVKNVQNWRAKKKKERAK